MTRLTRDSGINQRTPIILISDDQSPAAVSQAFAAGASFFLYKPIDRGRLLKLIRATQGAIEHERRRFRRVALRSRVHIGHEQQEWEGETIDVSLNGMLVKGPTSLTAGMTVRVNLYLSPEMKPIVGLGSVMRLLNGNEIRDSTEPTDAGGNRAAPGLLLGSRRFSARVNRSYLRRLLRAYDPWQ